MLFINTENGYLTLDNRENFNIVYDYGGEQTLSFDISPNDINYPYIIEKAKLIYGDNRYNVRKINKRKTMSTVTAELDLNEWKTRIHINFHTEYDLFVDVIKLITPEGWVFDDAGAAKGGGAITLEGVTDYDVLMACKNIYGIAFEYHIADRRIKVIDPLVVQERGLYLTDELNLDSVEYKGDFTQQANRLYAYGKKEEIENEDGTKTTTYVNFAGINRGKNYVDCMDYVSGEIVCAYWQDDRYTLPENLLTDAIEKVRALAYPVQAWNCNIHDLSRTSDMYKILDFKLYDKPTLLTEGQAIVHQIVQYADYPDNQNLNKVVLSTAFKKIQGEISEIRTDINDLDANIKIKEVLINEIRRDVNSNTLLIRDTYRKGDIDTQLSSIIQQTEKDINLAVGSVETDFYYRIAGSGNIYSDCGVSIKKDSTITTEVSLDAMPLAINKDMLRNRNIVISVDIYARKAVPKSLSGYMGAYFTVTYIDDTIKKYMCAFYPGVRYFQQQLALGSTSIYQRIYTTTTIDDKAIKSVSNLTIVIACNGETLRVSNPKVEIGKEPVNGEIGTLERMRKAEMKITPEAIIQVVSEKIDNGGEIKTAKFTLDKDGGHFSGGGIDISNNAGDKVFYADTEGNLVLNNIKASGTIESSILIGGEITGSSLDTTKDISVGRNIKLLPKDEGQLKEITFGRGNLHYYKMENEYFTGIQTSYDASGTTAWVRTSCGVKNDIEPECIQAEAVMYACSHGGNKQTQLRVYGQGVKIEGGDMEILTNVHISGSLHVSGAKNRLVMLDESNGILMGAVESTECVFEDIGHAKINDDGYCTIVLDELFIKTVNTKVLYYVFLTAMGKGELHVINKREHSFQVCGTSGLEFDWRITAKQKGYENVRMKKYKKEDY